MTPQPVAAVRGLASYAVPRPAVQTDLRLDGNEGCAPPPEVLGPLTAAGTELVRRYPDAARLAARAGEVFGLEPARILATAGADEGLDRVCRAFLEPGRSILLPEPGFEMLEKYAALAGAEIARYPWLDEPFPVDDVVARISPATTIVAVVSPNNPTGLAVSEGEFRAVAAAARDSLLLVDLAYAEFASFDLMRVTLEYDNAVIVRSLSKSWGIAGLRTGFLYAPDRWVEPLRVAGSPYSLAGPSIAIAEAWLASGREHVAAFVQAVRGRRERIAEILRGAGLSVWPSQANFVLARFGDAASAHEAFARRGIAVRAFPNHPQLASCLRITCPASEADMTRLEAALDEVLQEPST